MMQAKLFKGTQAVGVEKPVPYFNLFINSEILYTKSKMVKIPIYLYRLYWFQARTPGGDDKKKLSV